MPGGANDAVFLPRRYSVCRHRLGTPCLDLHKGDRVAAPDNDVDLSGRGPDATADDPVSFETQQQRSESLCATAASFAVPAILPAGGAIMGAAAQVSSPPTGG